MGRNNMENSPMKRNKFEKQVHRGIKGTGENGWTDGGRRERE
jgi:hypothetical protein